MMYIENNSTTIILCCLDVLILITGFWFRLYPPKKINFFAGYRTKNSMKDQRRWNFAHYYLGKLFILLGVILFLLALLVSLFNASSHNLNIIVVIFFIIGSFIIIFKTERAIIKKFDK